jgi:dephospho-CoA kinase
VTPGSRGPGHGRDRAFRIGLTGPIGCGKSTVAGWLGELGAVVVDADEIARSVTDPGSATLEAVIDRFGVDVLRTDGALDRAALGRLVFSDPAALADLEAIIHPAVRPRIVAAVAAVDSAGVAAVVIEAIKLIEAGYAAECDEVWFIDCAPPTQRERLLGRGMNPVDADQRMAAQADPSRRAREAADRIVSTEGPPAEAKERVVREFRDGLDRSAARRAGG